MLKLRQLSILIAVIIIANGVHAASMTVSTVQEFHAALKVAETNLQSDTILLAPGVYQVDDLAGQLLTYLPNGTDPGAENYELTISATNGVAIIDGNASKQGMRLDAFGTDMENAHITVQGLKFRECRISSTFFTGAGLYVRTQNANILIENCLFTYCIASAFFEDPNGGGCFAKAGGAGTAVVRNCRFWDNRADIFGGGLYMVGGANVRVENCTFLRNEGWRGGAFYINANAQTYVYNCTFYNNIGNSTEAGGGMYLCMYNDNYTAILFNNIVWSNTAPLGTGADIYLEDDPNGNGTGAVVNVAYCDFSDLGATIGDNVTLNNNINLDPMLVSTNDTNCLLQITSPCIDAGTNIAGMVCDANGIPRPLDGDTNDTAVVDMGAYEFVHPFADTDHDCMLDRVEIEYQMDPTVSNEFVNFPPVFSAIEDKNVFYGNELQFSVVANDPNQNIPVLSAPVKPADAVFVDNGDGTGVFTWTPDQPGDIGTNTVRFIASDGAQETTNDVTIRVYSININSPLSGTMARIRKYLSISWSGAWALGAVDISLWRNGSIVLSITNNLSAPTSNMVWQTLLPACLTPATNYVLRVTDSDATNDYAVSACFSIFKYCFQDFDGDGVDDYGCYDAAGNYGQSPGSWYLMKSDEGFDGSVVFGYAGTVPVIGDFDGDGRADYGCYDAAGNCGQPPGSWYIMMSKDGFTTITFGYASTTPLARLVQ